MVLFGSSVPADAMITNVVLDEQCSRCYSLFMENKSKRTVISRRDRPAKAPLSQEAIVNAALSILNQDGLSGLSMRRVAATLDTGAASLYVYVANLQDLHALMLDEALGHVKLPKPTKDSWRQRLKSVLVSYMNVLIEKRGLAQLAQATIPFGNNSLRVIECILGLLREGGIEDEKAAWGFDLLTLYATAIAAERSLRDDDPTVLNQVEDVLRTIKPKDYPNIATMKETLLSGEESRTSWAIEVMIDGLIHSTFPTSSHASVTKQMGAGKKRIGRNKE